MNLSSTTALLICCLALASCKDEDGPDAYGNFEATETTVSAQTSGRLRLFEVREGEQLLEGQTVGLVDTTQLAAERDGLRAQIAGLRANQRALQVQATATRAQTGETSAGVGVLEAQLATAQTELARTQRLVAKQAATARELTERQGLVDALQAQLRQARARTSTINAQATVPGAQAAAVDGQVAAIEAQIRSMDARLGDATIKNPVAGTVLITIAERGEVVAPGSPLYTIADLSTLKLRAYASGAQLPNIRIGMPLDVLVDDGAGGLRTLPGKVSWIAAKAQFTPTPVQTRDERAELVYAFDIQVANPDGLLKIGMPGEVHFLATTAASASNTGAAANQ